MEKNKTIALGVIIVIAVIAIGFLAFSGNATDREYDELAQCMTEEGIKIYGAYWCSACNAQKEAFGSSWKYITYVECSTPEGQGQTTVCQEAGIRSYPTWEFPDGSRLVGVQPFDVLAEKSGCTLE